MKAVKINKIHYSTEKRFCGIIKANEKIMTVSVNLTHDGDWTSKELIHFRAHEYDSQDVGNIYIGLSCHGVHLAPMGKESREEIVVNKMRKDFDAYCNKHKSMQHVRCNVEAFKLFLDAKYKAVNCYSQREHVLKEWQA